MESLLLVEVLALLTLRVIDLSLEQRLTLESERVVSAEGILSVVSVMCKGHRAIFATYLDERVLRILCGLQTTESGA